MRHLTSLIVIIAVTVTGCSLFSSSAPVTPEPIATSTGSETGRVQPVAATGSGANTVSTATAIESIIGTKGVKTVPSQKEISDAGKKTTPAELASIPSSPGVLRGYYESYTVTDDGGAVPCDALAITEGSPDFIDAIVRRIGSGNTINRTNASGRILVTLDLSGVSNTLRSTILGSTNPMPIQVAVNWNKMKETEIPLCGSVISVTSAMQY